MKKDLITLFKEYGDKQEILAKLSESEDLRKYNNSELHIIAAIGDLENPNVTAIAQHMGMTKGGISKNIKKLTNLGLIDSYQADGNNRKVFYKLTASGEDVYKKHDIAHKNWTERDNSFFANYSEEEQGVIADFLEKYIEHIDSEIEKRS